MGFLYINKI